MAFLKSIVGLGLCSIYLLLVAIYMILDFTRKPSPLIFPDMTALITFPGLIVVLLALELIGVPDIPREYQVIVYLLGAVLNAAVLYLAGAGLEALFRFLMK